VDSEDARLRLRVVDWEAVKLEGPRVSVIRVKDG
jgi:hypothetical protein